MCRQAKCRVCGKTTWAGCGQHVDQVMAGVPRADRCAGHDQQRSSSASGQSGQSGQAGQSAPSMFGRLFGRG